MTTYNGVSLIEIAMNLQSKMESGNREALEELKNLTLLSLKMPTTLCHHDWFKLKGSAGSVYSTLGGRPLMYLGYRSHSLTMEWEV